MSELQRFKILVLTPLFYGALSLAVGTLLEIGVSAQAVVVGIDCAHLTARASSVDHAICEKPELVRVNNEIDNLSKRLEMTLTGPDKEALLDTEKPFLVQRNNCQNQGSRSTPSYDEAVRSCVERILVKRRDALNATLTSSQAIRAEIEQYTFVDGAFFQKYSNRLIGKRMDIFGCLVLRPGPTPASRTEGTIKGNGTNPSCEADGPSVSVVFKSMTESESNFFDTKMPFSWWHGVIEQRDGRLVLYLEDVLGKPLP